MTVDDVPGLLAALDRLSAGASPAWFPVDRIAAQARAELERVTAERDEYRLTAAAVIDALAEIRTHGMDPERTPDTQRAYEHAGELLADALPRLTDEDIKGGFWPDMTGGLDAVEYLAVLRGERDDEETPRA